MRDNIAANVGLDVQGHKVETELLEAAIPWISQNCMRGRKRDKDGNLVPDPQPDSLIQVMQTISRVHARAGITMAKVKWKNILNGMMDEYIHKYGVKALQPQSREPFTRDEINKLFSLPVGTFVDHKTRVGDNARWRGFEAGMGVSSETGDRRGDLTIDCRDDFPKQGKLNNKIIVKHKKL